VLVGLFLSICSDLNFNADVLQQLDASQSIESMLSNPFFPIAFVILVSNNADFDSPLLLADGLTAYRRPGPGRPPPTSTPTGGSGRRPFRALC
jgi:hypothetical protein